CGIFGHSVCIFLCFFFQAEDGIRDDLVTGVQTCALPILISPNPCRKFRHSTAQKTMNKWLNTLAAGGKIITGAATAIAAVGATRSEERRVGKEWRSRGTGGE